MKDKWTRKEVVESLQKRYFSLCEMQLLSEEKGENFKVRMVWVNYRQSLISTGVCCFDLTAREITETSACLIKRLHTPNPLKPGAIVTPSLPPFP